MAFVLATLAAALTCAAASPPSPPALPPELQQTSYFALDSRNIHDRGTARLVLAPVRKTHSALISEQERWEMRFDNMQPNVWHDPAVNKWRAWYNSFSSCGGNLTGPNHDPLAPVDCQAFASHCPGSKHDPPVKISTPAI
jgi:hypothetical protein